MTTLNFQLAHAVARTLEPGDEIVVTDLDHDANVSPWLLVAADHGLVVREAPIRAGDGTLDEDALEALLGERTRVVAFTLASNALGIDHRRRSDRRRGRARGCARLGGRRAPGPAPAAAPRRARDPRPALLALQVLRPAPRGGRDRAWAGRVATRGPCPAGRGVAARAPLRDRHAVARGDSRHDRRDRLPALARRRRPRRGVRADPRPRGGAVAALPRGAPRRCRGSTSTGSPIPAAWRSARPRSASTSATALRARWRRRLAELDIYVWDGDYYALAPMRALGLSERGAVRAGFLHYTTEDEVDRLLEALNELSGWASVAPGGRLRLGSPDARESSLRDAAPLAACVLARRSCPRRRSPARRRRHGRAQQQHARVHHGPLVPARTRSSRSPTRWPARTRTRSTRARTCSA